MKTKIIPYENEAGMREAAKIIKKGGLVAFPTETVYGLGANALDAGAAKKIYAAKGRPSDNPLIVHLARPEDAQRYAYATETYYILAAAFMPGPLTVILKKKDIIPNSVTGNLDTVGIRVPSDPAAHKLISLAGLPIAAPSANLSGKPSTTTAAHVIADLYGKIDAIIDGGDAKIGLESTIVKEDGPGVIRILRPGAITKEMIEDLGFRVILDAAVLSKPADGERPQAPGMMYRHYAPRAKVVLFSGKDAAVEKALSKYGNDPHSVILCYEENRSLTTFDNCRVIGRRSDRENTAHRLFALLRDLDQNEEIKYVYSPLPDKTGIGLAIFNRMVKAAGYEIINAEQEEN